MSAAHVVNVIPGTKVPPLQSIQIVDFCFEHDEVDPRQIGVCMNAQAYFEEVSGVDDTQRLFRSLATLLNDQDLPHDVSCQRLFLMRHEDAKGRDWAQGRTASSLRVTDRYVRARVKALIKDASAANTVRRLDSDRSLLCLLIDGMVAGTSFDVAEARVLLRAKYSKLHPYGSFHITSDDQMRQILDEGVGSSDGALGVLERTCKKQGRRRSWVYRVTGQSLIRPRSDNPEALAGRACRAGRILLRIPEGNVHTLRANLGVRGLRHLLDHVINPAPVFRPLWDFIESEEERAKVRSSRKGLAAEDNAATLMGLALADCMEDAAANPLAPLNWAVAHSPIGKAEIWPLVFHADNRMRSAFRALQPAIHTALCDVLRDCERLDGRDDPRKPILLSYGWTTQL